MLGFGKFIKQTKSAVIAGYEKIFYSTLNQQSSQGTIIFYITLCQHPSSSIRGIRNVMLVQHPSQNIGHLFSEKYNKFFYFYAWLWKVRHVTSTFG